MVSHKDEFSLPVYPPQESTPPSEVVGSCCKCGSPIYGPRLVPATGDLVQVRRSCSCLGWQQSKNIMEAMQTKVIGNGASRDSNYYTK